jgi:hypothetical protein
MRRLIPILLGLALVEVWISFLPIGGECYAKTVALEPSKPAGTQHVGVSGSKNILSVGDLSLRAVGVLGRYDNPADKKSLQFTTFTVISVDDDNNLLIEHDQPTYTQREPFHATVESGQQMYQRISAAAASPSHGQDSIIHHHYTTMWVEGFSTKGIVDDDKVTIPYVVKVTGTKTYTTTEGAKSTVVVIEPYIETEEERQAKIKESLEVKEKEKAEKERQAAIEEAKWRTWTDSTGKYKTEAKFGGVAFDKVTLIKRDGSKVQLPLAKLSDEDQKWIKQRNK